METLEKSISVSVPVQTAYGQWTQFEAFPTFMESVRSVKQLDDKRLHWQANFGGRDAEWDAEIVEQIPDRRISWRSTTGPGHTGEVTFDPAGDASTTVNVRFEYDPAGFAESAADMLGVVSRSVEDDLQRFKAFIESRGAETGAWRGEIHGEQVTGQAAETPPL